MSVVKIISKIIDFQTWENVVKAHVFKEANRMADLLAKNGVNSNKK